MEKEANNSGVFAVVMAVLSILLSVSALPLGVLGGVACGVLGLIFGIVQIKSNKNAWAVWAIVLSVLGLVLNAAIIWMIVTVLREAAVQYQQFQDSGLIDNVKNAADLSQRYGGMFNAT